MIKIVFNKSENRSIAYDEEKIVGQCNFIEIENNWNIIHTEVNNLYQGQGIARKLVESVIESAKKYNKNVMAECSYAKKVLNK